jgi:hypothetical protein
MTLRTRPLRSDWRLVGSPLTDAQTARRSAMFAAIETAKAAINQAKA